MPVPKKKRASKAKSNGKKGKGKGKAHTNSELDEKSSMEEIEEMCPTDNQEIRVDDDGSEARGSDSDSVSDHFHAHDNRPLTFLFSRGRVYQMCRHP